MTDDDRFRLINQFRRHEDAEAARHPPRRFRMFLDSVGKWTIGWGRNLTDRGISDDEADFMLANDINEAEDDLGRMFDWFRTLDSVRQAAIVNIGTGIGLPRLLSFERALGAMATRDYERAALEFLDSKWARQVGRRAVELAEQVRTGEWGT
jgi:lysozyme